MFNKNKIKRILQKLNQNVRNFICGLQNEVGIPKKNMHIYITLHIQFIVSVHKSQLS